ncbi:MAG TPA: glycosyltransferase family 4 protein [Chitinophagaceae bacterium]|nr:glycosyltransferase family 4 protein [Chitinophagaceae bacterium]
MNILWLASWYPTKLSPLNGDFIQRHAQAVSLYHDIVVLHLCRDEKGIITNDYQLVEKKEGNLTELILYYKSILIGINFLDRFFSGVKYRRLFKMVVTDYLAKNGNPSIVHIHIGMNAGLIALWLKKKFAIKYVVTEHWSGLLPEAKNSFYERPFLFKALWKKIIQGASAISVVSEYLGKTIRENIAPVSYTVIPNVVNTNIFKYSDKRLCSTTRFIHISRMDYQKNPEAIFKAFSIVNKNNPDFTLTIYSNELKKAEQLAIDYQLKDKVNCRVETTQSELAKAMQESDALILFSRYETFGCVIIEANACGLPVIVSNIPTMHELVHEKVNGVFANNESAEDLAEKINWFMQNKQLFDAASISATASEMYNYNKIGKQFSDWYKTL